MEHTTIFLLLLLTFHTTCIRVSKPNPEDYEPYLKVSIFRQAEEVAKAIVADVKNIRQGYTAPLYYDSETHKGTYRRRVCVLFPERANHVDSVEIVPGTKTYDYDPQSIVNPLRDVAKSARVLIPDLGEPKDKVERKKSNGWRRPAETVEWNVAFAKANGKNYQDICVATIEVPISIEPPYYFPTFHNAGQAGKATTFDDIFISIIASSWGLNTRWKLNLDTLHWEVDPESNTQYFSWVLPALEKFSLTPTVLPLPQVPLPTNRN